MEVAEEAERASLLRQQKFYGTGWSSGLNEFGNC